MDCVNLSSLLSETFRTRSSCLILVQAAFGNLPWSVVLTHLQVFFQKEMGENLHSKRVNRITILKLHSKRVNRITILKLHSKRVKRITILKLHSKRVYQPWITPLCPSPCPFWLVPPPPVSSSVGSSETTCTLIHSGQSTLLDSVYSPWRWRCWSSCWSSDWRTFPRVWFHLEVKNTLGTSGEILGKTTLKTSQEDLIKSTLKTSEENVDRITFLSEERDLGFPMILCLLIIGGVVATVTTSMVMSILLNVTTHQARGMVQNYTRNECSFRPCRYFTPSRSSQRLQVDCWFP